MSSLGIQVSIGCEGCYDLVGDVDGPREMKCEETIDGVSMYVCKRCQRRVSVGISINGVDYGRL